MSDRLAGPEGKIQAINFGLNIEGVPFHLFVADVTSEELDQLQQDPSLLPRGLVSRWASDVEAAEVTESQRLFLVQARTDFAVFKLREHPDLPACHALR